MDTSGAGPFGGGKGSALPGRRAAVETRERRVQMLNYQHLFYFYTVVREGGVVRAAERLHLAQPTISSQVRALEESLGEKLLMRRGRTVALTETGRLVYEYAEEIFAVGRELVDAVKDRPTGRPLRLSVGIVDVMSKTIAYRLLAPALAVGQPVHLICREDRPERLLADLSVHGLDVVLADGPVPSSIKVRAFTHLLGESGVSFFAAASLASTLRRQFPTSLTQAPILLPSENTMLRRQLDQWFADRAIRPHVVGEFDDSALLSVFAQSGGGVMAGPTVVEREMRTQFGLRVIGRVPDVRERFYAISVERRIHHPAVVAISEAAKARLFA
jgi:LysR family transcriptional regulator, transcriptional activator of nhaA